MGSHDGSPRSSSENAARAFALLTLLAAGVGGAAILGVLLLAGLVVGAVLLGALVVIAAVLVTVSAVVGLVLVAACALLVGAVALALVVPLLLLLAVSGTAAWIRRERHVEAEVRPEPVIAA